LRAVWTGGDIGATATLYLAGWEFMDMRELVGLP
jgi:hypothetical protein